MKASKKIFISMVLLAGLYLGLNTLLAIPLIDEDKSKTRELSLTLKEDLGTIKSSFVTHTQELMYDTLSLSRFDTINKLLGLNNNGAFLKNNLSTRILDQKFVLENQIDIYYYNYLNANLNGLNAKKRARNIFLKKYKDACSKAESALFDNTRGIRTNILRLYATVKNDSTKSLLLSRNEYSKLADFFRFAPITPETDFDVNELSKNTAFKIFFLANIVAKDESQTLALILGLIGFGLLGSVIGTFGRSNVETDETNKSYVVSSIFSTLIKSFSASVITYLSIKGGLSIITSNNENSANPYFILFICFIASVYSDEIWQWAKNKIFTAK